MRNRVSVIIPCYNLANTVGRMLDSILTQTYPNIEVIVVNDGSTDHSESVILSYEEKFQQSGRVFKYIKQENGGLGAAINTGLREITGEYFCWGDADDYYEPASFEDRVNILESNPGLAVVTSNAYIRKAENLDDARLLAKNNEINNSPDQFLYHLNGDSIFCSGCHMVRTSMFQEVYPDMQIYPARRGQNWQLLLPLYFKYKRYFLDLPLYNYIVYPNSMSRDRDCQEDKIKRFNEHETILNEVLKHIAITEKVDLKEYSRFLDDKYGKLRMEVYLRFGDEKSFKQEYINKQHNVGIDRYDRAALHRLSSRAYRFLCRYTFRVTKGYYPEEIAENMLFKVKDVRNKVFDEPRVSVLIPVFNGEKYIDQCFGHLLNQRYSNIEIIVVNDGSTDDTEEILIKYEEIFEKRGFRYIHVYQQNARMAVAMNNALQYVTGKYLMLHDVDDILYKDGICDKVDYLEDNPNVIMVRNNGYYIKSYSEIEMNPFIYRNKEKNEYTVFEDILFGKTNNWPASYLIRAKDFFEILGGNHRIVEHTGGQNLQFMLPAAYNKKVGFIDKPLMDYYIHADSESHSGGYEANMRRCCWYEEIRQEVIKRIDMPEDKRAVYSQKLKKMYGRNKMQLARSFGDREKYQQYADELHIPTWKSNLSWLFDSSKVGKAVKYLSKVANVAERKVGIKCYNTKLWSENSKGYS